jgi:hypothetical protein
LRAIQKLHERGSRLGGETLTWIPQGTKLKPLKDWMILEVEEFLYSRYLLVRRDKRPIVGRVLAIGPGTYPKRYDHPDKHKRTCTWDSKAFLPTETKVGDRVQVGGEIDYAYEQFWWGDKLCLWCTERDVHFVYSEGVGEGPASRCT